MAPATFPISITASTLLMLLLVALLVFWLVGAYKRLMRLRSAISAAFEHMDGPLQQRYALLPQLLERCRPYLPDDAEQLTNLQRARDQALVAAQDLRSQPSQIHAAVAFNGAEYALATGLSALMAKLTAQSPTTPALAADEALRDLGAEIGELDSRIGFACQLFNKAVLAYNDAVAQFPAMVLARVAGFAPAATLGTAPTPAKTVTIRLTI